MQSSRLPKGVRGILIHFADLKDPRVVGRCDYSLPSILVIALLGVLCGIEGWSDLAAFAKTKWPWLRTFLDVPEAPPGEGVFRRVFSAIRPTAFEACMRAWVQSLAEPLEGQVVAFDGKALRGAIARAFGRTALHQVHAWVGKQRLLLAQRAVAGAPEEGEAIRTMLETLELTGAIVTLDAGNASTETVQTIVEAEADYVITVKGNRRKLHGALRDFFTEAAARSFKGIKVTYQVTQERGHGRDEIRKVWAVPASALGEMAAYWPSMQSIVMIERTRVLADGTIQQWTHYYASSLPPRVRRLAAVIREHWGVENGLHWALDVQMGEDDCPVRDAHGATNLALLRRIALMLIKREVGSKKSVRLKQKMAGWDNDFLLHLLTRGIA